ncbi:MAG TPA: secretin N-terminal domain-containing protein [Thermoanaerobaculia bacterium]|nr:secretin N-terminal domain-containing protein [Thermoanaerobaculia bacterium]
MSSVRRTVLILLWVASACAPVAPIAPAWAQVIRKDGELVLHAFTLRHRGAMEAIQLVSPMLSKRGTVELQPSTNTLVIRDTPAALGQIIPALRRYDHPSRPLSLDIYIVRATRAQIGPSQSDLPEALTRRLRALLPYDNYFGQAQARLSSREGEAVTYALGGEYEVSFRLGSIMERQRVRLSDFRIFRRSEMRRTGQSLIHTTVILPLDQTTSFVLARHEGSQEALMVVLTLRQGGQLIPVQPKP